jgi:dipicolinate synthase subunit A
MRMLVVGGDKRSGYLAKLAMEKGWHVDAIWLDQFDPAFACHWPQDHTYDITVLPYPFCERDGMILTPLATKSLPAQEAAVRIPEGARVMTGSLGDLLQGVARARHWRVSNPGWEEAFAVGNAVPSAEGAISVAMAASDTGIHGSNCLVIGDGRLGRTLARMLRGLGAHVWVAARKAKDRAWIRAEGHAACDLPELPKRLPEVHFVFNTVPAQVLDEPLIALTRTDVRLIDLASAPYGVDISAASRLGREARIEPSLPGRYAPRYAGAVLLEVVEELMKE